MLLQNFEEGKAIHAWHVQIERDYIRLQSQDLIPRPIGVACGAHDVNFGIQG